jgi:predicted nucleic acid-binding protein
VFSHRNLNLERVSVPIPSPELHALAQGLALDQGEIESLGLMEQYPNAFFLTDDAAARLVAEQRGYRVHGTIGLLIQSVRGGQRTSGEIIELLRALPQRSTLFIRPNLLQTIVEQLEKEWTIK